MLIGVHRVPVPLATALLILAFTAHRAAAARVTRSAIPARSNQVEEVFHQAAGEQNPHRCGIHSCCGLLRPNVTLASRRLWHAFEDVDRQLTSAQAHLISGSYSNQTSLLHRRPAHQVAVSVGGVAGDPSAVKMQSVDSTSGHDRDVEPPYWDGPVWQDLRLLASFAMGIACVHLAEVFRVDHGESESSSAANQQRAKFEMYPYVL